MVRGYIETDRSFQIIYFISSIKHFLKQSINQSIQGTMKQKVNIIPNSNQRTDLCRKKWNWTEIYIMRNLKTTKIKKKIRPTI